MARASEEEIAELLGDRAEESSPASAIVQEVRSILEELPYFEDLLDQTANHEDEHEGLTVIDELHD